MAGTRRQLLKMILVLTMGRGMDAWLEDSNVGHLYMEIRGNVSIGSLNGYEMGLDRIG